MTKTLKIDGMSCMHCAGTVTKALNAIDGVAKVAMYAKGMSQRDIEDNLREIYGADVSGTMILRITDKILPEVLVSIFA